MAIVKRTRSSELPQQNEVVRAAVDTSKHTVPKKTSIEEWREARERFTSAGISEDTFLKNPAYFSEKLKSAGLRPRKKQVLGNITYGEVESAIWSSAGSIGVVAHTLRISVYHVKSIFKRYKLLEQEFIEFKETILDEVESCLLTKARMGDTIAMMFYLKCQGKGRGYIERSEGAVAKRGVKMKIVRASSVKKEKKSLALSSSNNVLKFAKADVNG